MSPRPGTAGPIRLAVAISLTAAALTAAPIAAVHGSVVSPTTTPCIADGMFWACGSYLTLAACNTARTALGGHAPQQPNLPLECSFQRDTRNWRLSVRMV